MSNQLLFLGTGGSVGVPLIGCNCAVCTSKDALNQRLRSSVLIRYQKRDFLIDVSPDFRYQALRYGITKLDGILFTHAHHDHTAGLDDLRPLHFWQRAPLPLLLSQETAEDLYIRFNYLFRSNSEKPQGEFFSLQFLSDLTGEVLFQGVKLRYVSYRQGGMLVNGYRFGDLAYLSDIKDFSNSIFEELKGVKYLIISALRYTDSPLHFSVDDAIAFAQQLKAEQVWLTHLSHDLEHHATNAYLPSNMRLAYDGLQIEFE